jgi:hypothetical protein
MFGSVSNEQSFSSHFVVVATTENKPEDKASSTKSRLTMNS